MTEVDRLKLRYSMLNNPPRHGGGEGLEDGEEKWVEYFREYKQRLENYRPPIRRLNQKWQGGGLNLLQNFLVQKERELNASEIQQRPSWIWDDLNQQAPLAYELVAFLECRSVGTQGLANGGYADRECWIVGAVIQDDFEHESIEDHCIMLRKFVEKQVTPWRSCIVVMIATEKMKSSVLDTVFPTTNLVECPSSHRDGGLNCGINCKTFCWEYRNFGQGADEVLEQLYSNIVSGKTAEIRRQIRNSPNLVSEANDQLQTALHIASGIDGRQGNPNRAMEMVQIIWDTEPFMVDGCVTDTDLRTPLHMAARAGNTDVMDFLLSRGVDPNARDERMITPLHLVAKVGDSDGVCLLLDRDADFNAIDNLNESTPLHWASKAGNTDAVEVLLDRGADVNARDKDQCTPLYLAIEAKRVDTVDTLLGHGFEDIDWGRKVSKGKYSGITERARAVSAADKEHISGIVRLLVRRLTQIRELKRKTVNPMVSNGAALLHLIVHHDLLDEISPTLDRVVAKLENGVAATLQVDLNGHPNWQGAVDREWGAGVTLLDIAATLAHSRLVQEIVKQSVANPPPVPREGASPLRLIDPLRKCRKPMNRDVISNLIRYCRASNPPLESRERLLQVAISHELDETLISEIEEGGN